MYPTRAFHLFTRFSIPVAVFLFLAAVVVLLAASCGGEDRDISESRESAERERESATRPLSAATAEPEATAEAARPVSSSGESAIKSGGETISAGDSHTCRVREDGSVECWGWNEFGQARPPAGEFISVSAGAFHTCGVRTDGSVACWGSDEHGQANPPEGEFSSVSAGHDNTCGVETNGSVECWGLYFDGLIPPPSYGFATVSVGNDHACGVVEFDRTGRLPKGSIDCWGTGHYGQTTAPRGEFTSVSAGAYHACGVKTDGSVACWGGTNSNYGQAQPPEGEFSSISGAISHTCGVKTDGSIVCWGVGGAGQADPPEGEFASVAAGTYHTCGEKTDGSTVCWGNDAHGRATPPGAMAVAEPTLAPPATAAPAPTTAPTEAPAPTAAPATPAPTAAPVPPTPTAAPQSTPTPAPVMPTPGPTVTPAPTATPAPTPTPAMSPLQKYAAEHAGGPGAIYLGDLNQLVGPGPKDEWGNSLGNVTLSALQDHLWLYESDYYKSLIKKANLTNPTSLQSSCNRISIQHVCINRGLLSCILLQDYLAPNLEARTNSQLMLTAPSFPEMGLKGQDVLQLLSDGTLNSATVYSGYVGGELPHVEILNLWGLYSSREQEFEVSQAIISDIDRLVIGDIGGAIINHNWHGDQFLFCRGSNFQGANISSHGPALSDWINGMDAQAQDQFRLSSLELYAALESGTLDCAASWASAGYGEYWYEVIDYIIGPLPRFSFSTNAINGDEWGRIPHDLQQIIIEEAAKSELEALRLAAIQNEIGLQRNIDAGMEFIPFSNEVNRRSLEVAMNSVIPNWVNRVGDPDHPIVAETFNRKVGPIVGLRIQRNGEVVKTN